MAISTPRRTAGTVYRRWLRRGFSPAEAGNLTALQIRLRPSSTSPWTADGIDKLLSLRFQVRQGWLADDTTTTTATELRRSLSTALRARLAAMR